MLLTIATSATGAIPCDSLKNIKTGKLTERLSNITSTSLTSYRNPALRQYQYITELSTISGYWNKELSSTTRIAQEGKGQRNLNIQVTTYSHPKTNSAVWGSATYRKGLRYEVYLNETSDLNLIYPYYSADTIGGNMDCEKYIFNGGYAVNRGAWNFGSEMQYISGKEYRDKDPRPKNTTLNVQFKLGASYNFHKYSIGAYLLGGKYSQDSDIAFFKPQGVSMIYLMTGLGCHYFRFKGNQTKTRYDGSFSGIGLTIAPTDREGFNLAMTIDRFHTDRQLGKSRDISINDLYNWKYKTEAAFTNRKNNYTWRILTGFDYNKRIGESHIFDNGETYYHNIGTMQLFNMRIKKTSLKNFNEYNTSKRFTIEINPSVVLNKIDIRHTLPYRKLLCQNIQFKVETGARFTNKYGILTTRAFAEYSNSIDFDLIMNEKKEEFNFLYPTIENNYAMLASSYTSTGLQIRADIFCGSKFDSIFLKGIFSYNRYKNGAHKYYISLKTGITF